MTAAVHRIAHGLGLHRDGTRFGLSPFETETRHRLWWSIYLLDLRASEYRGIGLQTCFPGKVEEDRTVDCALVVGLGLARRPAGLGVTTSLTNLPA